MCALRGLLLTCGVTNPAPKMIRPHLAPVPGVSEYGLRIMDESVEEVIGDVRPGKAKCGWCGEITEATNKVCPKCGKDEYMKVF